jgi:hypothetical protein
MNAMRQLPVRMIAAGLGVVAMLLLGLVAPIHHGHAVASGLAKADVANHGVHKHGDAPLPAEEPDLLNHCLVCTLGKMSGALAPHWAESILQPPLLAEPIHFTHYSPTRAPSRPEHIAQPRAPPVMA